MEDIIPRALHQEEHPQTNSELLDGRDEMFPPNT